ncbi:hypothetical protein [Rubellimicrobium aerolatum]|uniref:SPOR domain-containing protein n=1 Tax=Rubellimicrobium aerolatum TaxID=490979 RepID=A0ABW0S7R3_9RHOB|nr:hypothetical protein [Rubellimicrobium aerolatum]MBP1804581.1 hypothetical protein [Rubellimicrobium aerolatum]
MSAPNTNIDKQAHRHRGPLRGMFAVVLFALILLGLLAFWAFGRGGDPEGAAAQVNDATGAVEPAAADTAGPSANDFAEDDANAGTAPAADPTAVTVAPETVVAPDSGAGNPADTDPGESQAAEPLNPVTDESDAAAPAAGSENE